MELTIIAVLYALGAVAVYWLLIFIDEFYNGDSCIGLNLFLSAEQWLVFAIGGAVLAVAYAVAAWMDMRMTRKWAKGLTLLIKEEGRREMKKRHRDGMESASE